MIYSNESNTLCSKGCILDCIILLTTPKFFIFGSKLTEKLRVVIQHFMEDQSNTVNKERAFIVNKGFRRVADNVPDDAHTLL